MNIAYDCVAIWVGLTNRNYLLEIFREDYCTSVPNACSTATCLFFYKDRPTVLFHSRTCETFKELSEYMEDKRRRNTVGSYTIIDYPKLVKECREWTYDY